MDKFHEICDTVETPTLVLAKTTKTFGSCIFGGYRHKLWGSSEHDKKEFLFSLKGPGGFAPKKISQKDNASALFLSVCMDDNGGPVFGNGKLYVVEGGCVLNFRRPYILRI